MKITLRKEELIVYMESIKKFITFPKSHCKYQVVYNFLVSNPEDEDGFFDLFMGVATEAIEKYSEGAIKANEQGVAVFDGLELPADVLGKIKELRAAGYSWEQHQKFWARCLLNPRRESVADLFRFISNHNLTITTEGKFIAYKAITRDFKDKHTQTIDNYPGCVVTMDRAKVAFDPHQACSSGLHVANLNYARGFACGDDIIVLVEVDPSDVVSVPYDSNAEKIRTCRYKVLRIWDEDVDDELSTSVVSVDENTGGLSGTAKECEVVQQPIKEFSVEGWTDTMDEILKAAVIAKGPDWDVISKTFFTGVKSAEECKARYTELEETCDDDGWDDSDDYDDPIYDAQDEDAPDGWDDPDRYGSPMPTEGNKASDAGEPPKSEESIKPVTGKFWSKTDDDKLIEMRKRGYRYRDIGAALGRSSNAVEHRVRVLKDEGIL